jgi:hypothetical protein
MTGAVRFLIAVSVLLSGYRPALAADTASWQAEWRSPFCEISTGNANDLRMSVWSIPGSDGMEIYLSGARAPRTTNTSDVELKLIPDDGEFRAHASWEGFSWRGFLHLTVVEGREFADRFAASRGLAVQDTRTFVTVQYAFAGDAMRAFRECLETHEREWGVDPSAVAALKVRPEVIADTWMRGSDYPGDALDKLQEGIVVMRLTTDETGKVVSCAIVDSIATKSMKDLTCRLALKRARFKIAIGADERPTKATFITAVRFHVWQ